MSKPEHMVVLEALPDSGGITPPEIFTQTGVPLARVLQILHQLSLRKTPYAGQVKDGHWRRLVKPADATFMNRGKGTKSKKPKPTKPLPASAAPAKKPLSTPAERFLKACEDFVGEFEHQREALEKMAAVMAEVMPVPVLISPKGIERLLDSVPTGVDHSSGNIGEISLNGTEGLDVSYRTDTVKIAGGGGSSS